MIKSALEVCTYRVSIRLISKVLVLCYKPHFITFSCYQDHLQGHQVVISDTANEFSTKLQREWSDQIALKMCTTRFPKIGRYRQHKIQRCSVHMNRKQKIPQIWKFWITWAMSWHWKANCNVENLSVCFLLATTQFEFVRFPPKKFRGRVNPQIQARRAKDVDVVLQAEYWVLI